jgi:hypothetical protein
VKKTFHITHTQINSNGYFCNFTKNYNWNNLWMNQLTSSFLLKQNRGKKNRAKSCKILICSLKIKFWWIWTRHYNNIDKDISTNSPYNWFFTWWNRFSRGWSVT